MRDDQAASSEMFQKVLEQYLGPQIEEVGRLIEEQVDWDRGEAMPQVLIAFANHRKVHQLVRAIGVP